MCAEFVTLIQTVQSFHLVQNWDGTSSAGAKRLLGSRCPRRDPNVFPSVVLKPDLADSHGGIMSEERYLSMDEGTLRTLLEATLDLAERRQIRTAIRELRRKELEGYEEALASKRFRSEKSTERQENKENCPQSHQIDQDQMKTQTPLLDKLDEIKDVDELTILLRTAHEYEERKLIRAAIRKLRNEEIEAISSLVGRSRERDVDKPKKQENYADCSSSLMLEQDDLEERGHIRSQIRELRAAQTKEAKDAASKEIATGMLFLDPLPDQLSSSTPEPLTSLDSTDPSSLGKDSDQDQKNSEKCNIQGSCNSSWQMKSHDSTSSEESNGKEKTEGNSSSYQEEISCIDLEKDDDESAQVSIGSTAVDSGLLYSVECTKKEPVPHNMAQTSKISDVDKSNISKTSMGPSVEKIKTVSHTSDHPVDLSPFRRACSLRDSAKRFTEEPIEQPTFFGSRFASQRGDSSTRGSRILQQQQQLLQSASPSVRNKDSRLLPATREWTPGRSTADSLLHKRLDTSSKKGNRDRAEDTTVNPKHGFKTGMQGLSVQQRIKESQKKCVSETDGASQSKPVPKVTSTDDQSFRTESFKGASITDTGGRSNSTKEEGVEHCTLHQQSSQGDTLGGRSKDSQSEGTPVTSQRGHIKNSERSWEASKDPSALQATTTHHLPSKSLNSSQDIPAPGPGKDRQQNTRESKFTGSKEVSDPEHDDEMKTLLTIEIKDGRNPSASSRIIGAPGSQRAELTLGLGSSPFTVTTSRNSSNVVKVETEKPEQQKPAELVPNGMVKAQEDAPENRSKLSAEDLSRVEEEEVLDKMLDKTTDFEERRLIRSAMRELRQKKRDQREKERDQRLQEIKSKSTDGRNAKGARSMETTMSQSEKSVDGSSISTLTKTQRLVQSNDGNKTSRTTTMESSYMKRSEGGGTIVQTKASFSSTSKKVGSIFDREDDAASRASNLAALERRQAERKKELMKAQTLPKTSATQARKAMIDKLEKESGSPSSPAFSRVAVSQTSGFGVPNANSIKQMLLDWCKAKTRGYENVNIQNFSSSWSDGMAFCALVHNFFPEAFDFSDLNPQNRRKNFDLAFSTAEKHAECPQLLDVDDMVRMREPDWKCVYTYIQEFYRCLVQKGLVKTKQS
ncbi:smoothelin isoform X2 [Pleurodeles waltl]|uniref:smoothelin isoform X2 n=1 Tax=Pleurodeles waltl TaxID=8319 RepID=UPI003709855C